MPTGADALVAALHWHGVRDIFGMPGSHSTAIYDAIARHGGIRTILIRNEQAGAYAADGYARVTGRPSVICTTAGPGATNALSGIAEAYADSVPVLLVTGQVNHDRLHLECGAYHEIDLEAVLRPCTKYVNTLMRTDDIEEMVDAAFAVMTTSRRRPAALVLPQDLMGMNHVSSSEKPSLPRPAALSGRREEECGEREEEAAQLLGNAHHPIILAGGGAIWSDAGPEIRALAERLRCPVVTSLNGKGIIDERDQLSLGHARSIRAKSILPLADVMLAAGCRFTEVLTWFGKMPVPEKLVHIDIEPAQIGMNYQAHIGIVGDAKECVSHIIERLPALVQSEWGREWDAARNAKPERPEWLIETLRRELPDDAIVFTDACEMGLRMHMDWPTYAPRTFFYPSNYIALGWGLPAAIGAAVALPNRTIVSVSGDGGFLMTAQELATAVRYRLKIIAVVHNDSAYGAIRNLQRVKHEARFVDTELNNPDFVKFAGAFGVPAERAANADSFAAAIRTALERDGPSLIEVPDHWRSLRA